MSSLEQPQGRPTMQDHQRDRIFSSIPKYGGAPGERLDLWLIQFNDAVTDASIGRLAWIRPCIDKTAFLAAL